MRTWTPVLLILTSLIFWGCSTQQDGAGRAPAIQLSDADSALINTKMSLLSKPVTIDLYLGGGREKGSAEVKALLDLVSEASGNLTVVEHDLGGDPDQRKALGSEHGPIMVLTGPSKARISYFGYPQRKELSPCLDGILIASGSTLPLTSEARTFFDRLDREIIFKVFVTPD